MLAPGGGLRVNEFPSACAFQSVKLLSNASRPLRPVRASANVSYRGQFECFRLSRCDFTPHSYVRVVDNIVVLIEDKREFFSGKIVVREVHRGIRYDLRSCSWQLDSTRDNGLMSTTFENILDMLTRLADTLLIGSWQLVLISFSPCFNTFGVRFASALRHGVWSCLERDRWRRDVLAR